METNLLLFPSYGWRYGVWNMEWRLTLWSKVNLNLDQGVWLATGK